jgi:hypothetical protein
MLSIFALPNDSESRPLATVSVATNPIMQSLRLKAKLLPSIAALTRHHWFEYISLPVFQKCEESCTMPATKCNSGYHVESLITHLNIC